MATTPQQVLLNSADRLNKVVLSQKTGSEKRAESATLLQEISTDTCPVVILAMTKTVAICKEDTTFQAEFLDEMTHNLDNGNLTVSSAGEVIDEFKKCCGNLNTVSIVQRAFVRLQAAYSFAYEVARKDTKTKH